jgi:DNA polymerase elongation subunit (family B)
VGQPRILTLDIETAPAVVETFSLYDTTIPIHRVREPGYILGFGFKWYGSRRVDWVQSDGVAAVALAAREVLHEADIVVTYNGDKFDLRHLKRDIALHELTPPSPIKTVDLFKTVKRHFKFESNKLDFVASELGLGKKVQTDYSLWRRCMEDDEAAWRKMARYCKQDVKLTEALYDRLRPWITNHPHMGLWVDSIDGARLCPTCGSRNVHYQGTRTTISVTYKRLQCQDCGAWSRGTEIERRVNGRTRPV